MFVQNRIHHFGWLPGLLSVALAVLAVGPFFASWLNMPVMYKDHRSGTCVGVVTPAGLQDCSKRPIQYDVEFVAPGTTYRDLVLAARAVKYQ